MHIVIQLFLRAHFNCLMLFANLFMTMNKVLQLVLCFEDCSSSVLSPCMPTPGLWCVVAYNCFCTLVFLQRMWSGQCRSQIPKYSRTDQNIEYIK